MRPSTTISDKERESLKLVRDLIANEKNAFSMAETEFSPHVQEKHIPVDSFMGDCGTPACIWGWAKMLPDLNKRDIERVDSGLHAELFAPGFEDEQGNRRNWERDSWWFTRARTVAMLDHLAETGELHWELVDED